MLREFKFKTKERKLWVTSDTHFHHDREFIWGKRGFKNVTEHDESLISNWNGVVGLNDDVLHLGDFCLMTTMEQAMEYIRRLNGNIYFLWGNHNAGLKQLYQLELEKQYGVTGVEIYPLTYNNKFTFVGDYMKGYINGQAFCASHFAYRIWESSGKGSIFLSGHSHGTDPESLPNYLKCKRLDCGVENFNNTPVSSDEIMKIMFKKNLGIVDHHDSTRSSGL